MLKSLHRRLALRLGLGALIVGLLAGLATFFIEMERVDDAVLSLATSEAAAFAEQTPGPLIQSDADDIGRKLTVFLNSRQSTFRGHFLLAEVYDANQQDVAQAEEGLPPDVEHQIDTAPHRFPKHAQPWYRKILSGKQLYLQVVTPVFAADGTRRGYFEGVYHLPTSQLKEIRGRVASTVLLVVMVVVLTALALYPIILGLHREQQELSRNLLQANLDTLAVLGSAIAKRDSDTYAHNFRVALYALSLGELAGLKPAQLRELIKGAWLHDVGKIAISDTILLKPGKLDEAEFAIMKTHVAHGSDIVRHSSWLIGAAEVVSGHHEKWDGSGYPLGLSNDNIPLNARIFALADVFDALTSRRPYKEPLSCEQALAIMRQGRGSHFDPTLFDLFAASVEKDYRAFGGREDDHAQALLLQRGHPYFFDT